MARAGRPDRRRRDDASDRSRSSPDRGRRRREQTPGSHDLDGRQIEGFHAVRELLRARNRRVREVWLVDRAPGARALESLAAEVGVRVRFVTAEQLAERARSEAPQGVLALAAPVPDASVGSLLTGDAPFLVALDGVTDPGNLGAILRTAETAGATGVVVTRHRSARLGPTAVKAAAGAVEYLPVATVAGIPGFLDHARRAGLWTVGLDSDGPTPVTELGVAEGPVVLVLGAEGSGLSRLTRERCDVLASIPLHGQLESLNVAAAAAVALHAVAGRRAAGPGDRRR